MVNYSTLASLLSPRQVLTRRVDLLTYQVDAALDRGIPDAVVFPQSAEDVQRVARWAVDHQVPLVARGAGTGLSGGAVAEKGGVIVEFSRLNRILELDRDGRSAVVEPGVVNLKLDEFVKQAGLYYPPDPASGRSATLGGNIAENAGGPHCFKYGVTTNYLTGLEVVLAGGDRLRLGGRAFDYPEYDLVGVFTGSEGTLGIVTQASVRLVRNPPAVKTMMAAFQSVEAAGEAVSALIARGLVPATMEMMDQKMMRIIEAYVPAGLPLDAGAALIVEVDGYAASLEKQIGEITACLEACGAWGLRVAQSAEERERIWYGRKSAAGAMARLSPSFYLLDGTVPRSRLAEALAKVNQVCEAYELRVGYVFHAGDGNLHPFVLIEDAQDAALMKRVYQAGQEIMEICVSLEGSITGEHGVGIEKRRFMPLMFSSAELEAMRVVKEVFDPQGILNPGKIFPEEGIDPRMARTEQKEEGRGERSLPLTPERSLLRPTSPLPLEEETVELIRKWHREGKVVRIQGGGTKSSLFPPHAETCTLSTRSLSGIRRFAPEDLYVTAGAGTRLAELQAGLAEAKMQAPLIAPWAEATLGGTLAANFNAPLRMRYGGARDLLLAARVILPDGQLLSLGRPVVKNVAGYDLPKLMVGAYGTLGVLAQVTLKLAPLPRRRASLVAGAENLAQALDWGRRLLPLCLAASALLVCAGDPRLGEAPYSLIYTVEGLEGDVTAELEAARQALVQGKAASPHLEEGFSGSEAWAEWIRQAGGESCLARMGMAPKDLPGLLGANGAGLGNFYADLPSGLVYLQGDRAGARGTGWGKLKQAAQKSGGYAALLSAPDWTLSEGWGYRPESLPWMQRLQSRWDPHGRFNQGALLGKVMESPEYSVG